MEVCYNNIWGSVCNDDWDTDDAKVTCRQLGFPVNQATILTNMNVPEGMGQIWLDEVDCDGTENNLFECSAERIGRHNCDHSEDAGVMCGK